MWQADRRVGADAGPVPLLPGCNRRGTPLQPAEGNVAASTQQAAGPEATTAAADPLRADSKEPGRARPDLFSGGEQMLGLMYPDAMYAELRQISLDHFLAIFADEAVAVVHAN